MKKIQLIIYFTFGFCFSQSNCIPNANLVTNGSFESPTVRNLSIVNTPFWSNVFDNNKIEIQRTNFLGFGAVLGNQNAELNGNVGGNIFQVIPIDTGRPVYWSFCYA